MLNCTPARCFIFNSLWLITLQSLSSNSKFLFHDCWFQAALKFQNQRRNNLTRRKNWNINDEKPFQCFSMPADKLLLMAEVVPDWGLMLPFLMDGLDYFFILLNYNSCKYLKKHEQFYSSTSLCIFSVIVNCFRMFILLQNKDSLKS